MHMQIARRTTVKCVNVAHRHTYKVCGDYGPAVTHTLMMRRYSAANQDSSLSEDNCSTSISPGWHAAAD